MRSTQRATRHSWRRGGWATGERSLHYWRHLSRKHARIFESACERPCVYMLARLRTCARVRAYARASLRAFFAFCAPVFVGLRAWHACAHVRTSPRPLQAGVNVNAIEDCAHQRGRSRVCTHVRKCVRAYMCACVREGVHEYVRAYAPIYPMKVRTYMSTYVHMHAIGHVCGREYVSTYLCAPWKHACA